MAPWKLIVQNNAVENDNKNLCVKLEFVGWRWLWREGWEHTEESYYTEQS